VARTNNGNYDAVIIGAGVGGLVCGCYLAKAGMKVLIIEQHFKPGGYCTSFKRKNLIFDAAAHCFGGYRETGVTRNVFNYLGIDKKIKIIRRDPADIIIIPDYRVTFWANVEKTIEEFQSVFPEESSNIKKFFYFLLNPEPQFFSRMRSWTFKNLLDTYLTNEKLKTLLAFPLLGNGGLPPSSMSAFVGAKLFSEFLLDGGYYPEGGMQALPDALAEIFKEHSGELLLSCRVKKIRVKEKKVTGVVVEKRGFIQSNYVISDCDARQTFLNLLGKDKIKEDFSHTMDRMTPSLSDFILYLGVDKLFKSSLNPGTSFWFLSHYDLDTAYQSIQKGDLGSFPGGYMLRVSHDTSNIVAIMLAPFRNKRYWQNNKNKFLESFIATIEKSLIPELSRHIVYKDAATPYTLYRYTLNYKGAACGWEGTPAQLAVPNFKKPSFIQNLYLTGHWTTQGLGISGVVYVGSDTAKVILRKERNKFI
jgi:phytoene dehydrogenase-like protein